MLPTDISPGYCFHLGATVYPEGVNFCIFAKHAEAIELLLFDSPNAPKPYRTILLNSCNHRTFHYWHVLVKGLKSGQVYGYRAYGPFAPGKGHRYNPTKVLLDPYAKAIVGQEIYNRQAAIKSGDNCAQALRSVAVDTSTYDWEGDRPLHIPLNKTIIYEMHVGGFTLNPNSGVAQHKRGTYAGIIEKIPYLKQLGITAVELLPIHEFDEQDARPGRDNYWGYSTIGFFSPHRRYSSNRDPLGPLNEFRDLVKALHKAGIEVILDVVFNHTAEGNEKGPVLFFKGFDNTTYYILEEEHPARYSNYSGCGNTLNVNNPIVGRLIIQSLRYWVSEMHVDGFRFDLASIMSRDHLGNPVSDRIIPWFIESDPILAGTKMIAEAWDAAGLYQVGSFGGERFAEWNGPFRDDVRRFIKSDCSSVSKLAARILGSPDIYRQPQWNCNRSINFITCHDGFTLNDLVSYNVKHNEANGEDNQDGANDNFSWNCGWEGPINDPAIETLRKQQIKNLLTLLLTSQGTPMLLMGDEIRRTQLGNNNAYCQNNFLSWMDWDGIEKEAEILRFTTSLIKWIQQKEIFSCDKLLSIWETDQPHVVWHGVFPNKPDWTHNSHSLGVELVHPQAGERFYLIFNAYWDSLVFELPCVAKDKFWHRIVDTSLPAPWDFIDISNAKPFKGNKYVVPARTSVIFVQG